MSDANENNGFIRRFLDMSNDSVVKTVTVAVALCLVASMVVSAAAVSLRPVQEANKLRDKQTNVLEVAGVYDPNVPVAEAFESMEPHVLDLATGEFTDEFDIKTFDQLATSNDPAIVRALDEDPVLDVTQLGKVTAAGNFRYFETYNVVALIYLAMTITLSLALRRLEDHLRNKPG